MIPRFTMADRDSLDRYYTPYKVALPCLQHSTLFNGLPTNRPIKVMELGVGSGN